MARQVVILENFKEGSTQRVTGFHWFPIAVVAARVPRVGVVSAGAGLTGAKALTQAEQDALADGSVREERFNVDYPITVTLPEVQADLQKRWTAKKAEIDTDPPTRQFFGRTWDGAGWVA